LRLDFQEFQSSIFRFQAEMCPEDGLNSIASA